MSLRKQIVLLICVPLLAMSLCVGMYNFFSNRSFAVRNAEASMDLLAVHMASEADIRFRQIAQIGSALARRLSTGRFETSEDVYGVLEYAYTNSDTIYGGAVAFDEYAFSRDRRLFAPYVMRDDRRQGEYIRTEIAYDYTVQADPKNAWFTAQHKAAPPTGA